MQHCKHVIIGAGRTGIFLAKQLSKLSEKVLLIEQYGVGGSSVHNTDLPNHILYGRAEEFEHNLKFFSTKIERQAELIRYRRKVFSYIKWTIDKKEQEIETDLNNDPNISLLKAKAKFKRRNVIEITDAYSGEVKTISYGQVYITAGKNCLAGLKVKGIEQVPICHKWNYWKFDSIPSSIAMIGFNEETLEKADVYSSFGIKVDIFESKPSWECFEQMDLTATNYFLKQLIRKKVDFNFESPIKQVLYYDDKFNLTFHDNYKHQADQLYIPSIEIINGDYLNLKSLKLKHSNNGIVTNYKGNTNISNIFAFGSIIDPKQNKHKTIENFLKFKELRANRRLSNPITLVTNNLSKIQQDVNLLEKKMHTPSLQIKSTNQIVTIGLSEAMVKSKTRVTPKSLIFSHPNKEGFVKVIYHPNTNRILGFSSGGELAKSYSTFLKYSYKQNLKLQDIENFLKYDIYSS